MPLLTEKDLTKLAAAASSDLVENKIPLNQTISKLASDMDLSQEQIKRVCESANNTTFNLLFKGRDKTAADRMIEFKVADPDQILGSQIKQASVEETVLPQLRELRPLPDLVNVDETPAYIKTASAYEQQRDIRVESRNNEHDRRSLSKVQDYFRHEKIAKHDAYRDTLSALTTDFKRLYSDITFSEFEKTALSLHGQQAVDILNDLRTLRSQPKAEYNVSAFHKQGSLIDDTHPIYKKLATAVQTKKDMQRIDRAMLVVQKELG